MGDIQSGETKSGKRGCLTPGRFQLLYFALLPLALVATSCLAATPAQADDIVTVILSNLTFNGLNNCGPLGTALCTETFSGSYLWDNTTSTSVPNTAQATATGPLGTFTFSSAGTVPIVPGLFVQVSNWTNGNDFIEAFLHSQTASLPTGNYPLTNFVTDFVTVGTSAAVLHPCLSVTCQFDFGPSLVAASAGSVTVVPEPQTLALVASGILGLVVPLHKTRRWRGKASTL